MERDGCCQKCQCGVSTIVRLFHTGLCFAILITLLVKNTSLRWSLVELHNPVYGGMYLTLFGVSLILYYTTCLTGPGYVSIPKYRQKDTAVSVCSDDSEHTDEDTTLASSEDEPKYKKYQYRFCDYCEIKSPLRSKHCEDCKKCVHRYDHHCPWLETCVGERNHKFFWMFLLVTATLIIWSFVMVWESFVTEQTWTEWFHRNIVLFLVIVVLVISGPTVVGLFVFHTYLMFNGLTTWETTTRERITYLKYLDDEYNPFDEGTCNNLYSFFCIFHTRRWEVLYAQKAKFKDSGV